MFFEWFIENGKKMVFEILKTNELRYSEMTVFKMSIT